MSQAGYNVEALEDCRAELDGKAGPVGAVGDGFEGQHVDAAIFGQLDAAGSFASAITEFDATAKRQFDAAEQLLRSASSALDAVRTTMDEIDRANADALR
ncbi:hypothetical protein GCM10011581_42090 [Saccharopolyspora subtropica]|uniref:Uncharacterized protein n=1 Tax=Saccharopolyspora thermophila TaxID=89367 RepID=A0A917K713_9PSEU|nr:hypothetical protein [Saccharopolyspora subtropica]GGJ00543.1 hypothetical protein GCM10011581_42090 [Saccharopolyspora subtropica]